MLRYFRLPIASPLYPLERITRDLKVCQRSLGLSSTIKSHLTHFPARAQENKINLALKKKSFYFRNWNFLALMFKKILIFSQKDAFLIFSKIKKFLIFPETKLSSSDIKKILIFSLQKSFVMFSQMKPCSFQHRT